MRNFDNSEMHDITECEVARRNILDGLTDEMKFLKMSAADGLTEAVNIDFACRGIAGGLDDAVKFLKKDSLRRDDEELMDNMEVACAAHLDNMEAAFTEMKKRLLHLEAKHQELRMQSETNAHQATSKIDNNHNQLVQMLSTLMAQAPVAVAAAAAATSPSQA